VARPLASGCSNERASSVRSTVCTVCGRRKPGGTRFPSFVFLEKIEIIYAKTIFCVNRPGSSRRRSSGSHRARTVRLPKPPFFLPENKIPSAQNSLKKQFSFRIRRGGLRRRGPLSAPSKRARRGRGWGRQWGRGASVGGHSNRVFFKKKKLKSKFKQFSEMFFLVRPPRHGTGRSCTGRWIERRRRGGRRGTRFNRSW